ncbi:2-hydroxyacid dehydrogenase [Ferroplasma sp.]|uniref:2-hydroxyacid dehydrogenase n=1 Tax=Ferroplasma sp. TaxID=2591003 RepID=UPI00307FA91F
MLISLQVNFKALSIPDSFIKKMEEKTQCKIINGFSDDADIVVFAGKPLPGKKTVFMQSISAGVNHLDFNNIDSKIEISSNADAWSIPVAEHAFALILANYKNICSSNSNIRAGTYDRIPGKSLYGRTMGILGYGGIGREIAIRARPFGIHTIGFGRTEKEHPELDTFTKNIEDVAKNSHIAVITLPLNVYTKGIINNKFLSAFNGDAIVNVGRAEIVNKDDMLHYLIENPEKYFLTDVWWGEPDVKGPIPDNVIITPHVAGITQNFIYVPVEKAFDNVVSYLNGRPKNIVNRNDYV